jgi:hypothetical protein
MTILFRDIRFYGYCTYQTKNNPTYNCSPLSVLAAVILLSGGVLGIAAYFAAIFLPNINRMWSLHSHEFLVQVCDDLDDFSIFALIPPSWTIFILIMLCVYPFKAPRSSRIYLTLNDFSLISSSPRADAIYLFISGVLWLSKSLVSPRKHLLM